MSVASPVRSETRDSSSQTLMRGGVLQRACACGQHTVAGGECAECRKKRLNLQRQATNQAEPTTVPPIVNEVLRSPGQPLDAATRSFMEPRFGHDFSGVRVHTDARAAESARAVNALAYTVGSNMVFGTGQYARGTSGGQRLLAHELTHVVQQGTHSKPPNQLRLDASKGPLEREADNVATQILRSETQINAENIGHQAIQGTVQRRAIHSGDILFEGTCEHLACNSTWSCCNPSGIHCPGKTSSSASEACESEHWTPLFTCDNTCDRALSNGCDDSDNWMAIPNSRFARRKCNQDLVICANNRFTHARVRDRSHIEAWEVSPGIIDALGVPRGTLTGSIYGDENDPDFKKDNRCRSAGSSTATGSMLGSAITTVGEIIGSAVREVTDFFDF